MKLLPIIRMGVATVGFLSPCDGAPEVEWSVDLAGRGPVVSPTMHGVFFEDINYAGDGGLYAELVENRSYEHREAMHAWREERRGGGEGTVAMSAEAPVHANNPRFVRIEVVKPGDGVGVSNLGYGGIVLKGGADYRFAVHARRGAGGPDGLKVRLEGADGRVFGEARISGLSEAWRRHTVMLTSSADAAGARLVVLADAPGRVDLDMVSLFPKDTWKGRENGLRADLVKMLADLKPGFMRFPGGCIVEGNDLPNAYRWKDTVGDIAVRKQNWNRWIQDDPARPDHHYHQTYGLGFFEFFLLCEDIGAAPVPVLNCGMSCQFQAKQLVDPAELDPWVQDAIDLVEFANGAVTTRWGGLRAGMGHPEPFGMKHLGVGNEQWGPEYFKRYEVFYKALKAKCPEITLITTSGPGVDDEHWRYAWGRFRSGTPAEVVDEHYYRPPAWFLEQAARYDGYDRKGPRVFAGEYAAHRRDRASTLDAAVCEAAFLTGLLRNADVVTMSCYAPLLAREGFVQWTPDMIWFDAARVMPTPTYHVQRMYSANRPDRMLPSVFSGNRAVAGSAGRAGVGTWKTQAEFKDFRVTQGAKVLFRQGGGAWDLRSGSWKEDAGILRQDGGDEGAVALVGDASWTDCTVSVKARKTGGSEGFLILFRSADETQRCWWNLGGWSNTAHAIEANGVELGRVAGTIETGRWYDIRIEIQGGRITCLLDGRRIHEVRLPERQRLYGAAGLDEKAGEIVLQAANPSAEALPIRVRLHGARGNEARGEVLTAPGPDDRNTLESPAVVSPRPVRVKVEAGELRHTLPPWSHTTLRLGR